MLLAFVPRRQPRRRAGYVHTRSPIVGNVSNASGSDRPRRIRRAGLPGDHQSAFLSRRTGSPGADPIIEKGDSITQASALSNASEEEPKSRHGRLILPKL